MKKILFIGRPDETTNDIINYLGQYFEVKLCSEKTDVIQGMIKVINPEIAIIYMSPDVESYEETFYTLHTKYDHLPVLTIGTDECVKKYQRYYMDSQFKNVSADADFLQVGYECGKKLKIAMETGMESNMASPTRKKKILVVDDSAVFLRSVKTMLQDKFDVTVANSASMALTAIEKSVPDLILLDYDMPVIDGKQTFQMLRNGESTKRIPVLFLTAISDKKHVKEVLELKPEGYILKPPVPEKIIETICKTLNM